MDCQGYSSESWTFVITVSESTATGWLHCLGMKHGAYKKGMYVNGHARADVVQYRTAFLEQMLEYEKRMTKYEDKIVDDGILVAADFRQRSSPIGSRNA